MIKLDSDNYIFWKAQVLAMIRAFDLLPFLNKTPPPPKYVVDCDKGGSEAQTVTWHTLIGCDQISYF